MLKSLGTQAFFLIHQSAIIPSLHWLSIINHCFINQLINWYHQLSWWQDCGTQGSSTPIKSGPIRKPMQHNVPKKVNPSHGRKAPDYPVHHSTPHMEPSRPRAQGHQPCVQTPQIPVWSSPMGCVRQTNPNHGGPYPTTHSTQKIRC